MGTYQIMIELHSSQFLEVEFEFSLISDIFVLSEVFLQGLCKLKTGPVLASSIRDGLQEVIVEPLGLLSCFPPAVEFCSSECEF